MDEAVNCLGGFVRLVWLVYLLLYIIFVAYVHL
jgi:hypothetical protein